MKCRQIHLGCLLRLFPGAEWLPGDTSGPSPEQRRSRKSARSARSAIRRFTERGDGNKDGRLRKRGAVYSRGLVVGIKSTN